MELSARDRKRLEGVHPDLVARLGSLLDGWGEESSNEHAQELAGEHLMVTTVRRSAGDGLDGQRGALTWIWVMPPNWYSTGSSIVMMFLSIELIALSAA